MPYTSLANICCLLPKVDTLLGCILTKCVSIRCDGVSLLMEVPLFLQPGPSTLGQNINVAQFRDDNDDNGDNRNNDDDISAAEA